MEADGARETKPHERKTGNIDYLVVEYPLYSITIFK
jgi:hypothetical protein